MVQSIYINNYKKFMTSNNAQINRHQFTRKSCRDLIVNYVKMAARNALMQITQQLSVKHAKMIMKWLMDTVNGRVCQLALLFNL